MNLYRVKFTKKAYYKALEMHRKICNTIFMILISIQLVNMGINHDSMLEFIPISITIGTLIIAYRIFMMGKTYDLITANKSTNELMLNKLLPILDNSYFTSTGNTKGKVYDDLLKRLKEKNLNFLNNNRSLEITFRLISFKPNITIYTQRIDSDMQEKNDITVTNKTSTKFNEKLLYKLIIFSMEFELVTSSSEINNIKEKLDLLKLYRI